MPLCLSHGSVLGCANPKLLGAANSVNEQHGSSSPFTLRHYKSLGPGSLPTWTSLSTVSKWPAEAADTTGIQPLLLRADTSAPAARSLTTSSVAPATRGHEQGRQCACLR